MALTIDNLTFCVLQTTVQRVVEDNNAVYRAISLALVQNELHHTTIRNSLAIFIQINRNKLFDASVLCAKDYIFRSFVESILSLDFPAWLNEIHLLVILLQTPITVCLQQGTESQNSFTTDRETQYFFNRTLLNVNTYFSNNTTNPPITLVFEGGFFCGLHTIANDPIEHQICAINNVSVLSNLIYQPCFSAAIQLTLTDINTYTLTRFKVLFNHTGGFNHSARVDDCRKIANFATIDDFEPNACTPPPKRLRRGNTTIENCYSQPHDSHNSHYSPPPDSENLKRIDAWLDSEETEDLSVCICCKLFLSCLPQQSNNKTINIDKLIYKKNDVLGYDTIPQSVWQFAKKALCYTCSNQLKRNPNSVPNNSAKSSALSLGSINEEDASTLKKLNLVENMILSSVEGKPFFLSKWVKNRNDLKVKR